LGGVYVLGAVLFFGGAYVLDGVLFLGGVTVRISVLCEPVTEACVVLGR